MVESDFLCVIGWASHLSHPPWRFAVANGFLLIKTVTFSTKEEVPEISEEIEDQLGREVHLSM